MSSSRKKSCQECRAAKARCDLLFPCCSRCLERRKSCQYDRSLAPRRSSSHRVKIAKSITTAITPPRLVEVAVDSNQSWPSSDHLPTDVVPLDQVDNADWLMSDFNCETDPALAGFKPICELDLLSTDWSFSSTLPLDNECSATETNDVCPESFNTIPYDISQMNKCQIGPLPAQTLTAGFMSNMTHSSRSGHAVEASLNVSMMVGKVSHFPRMIIEGPCLPPFIHPRCATRGSLETFDMYQIRNLLLEPLAICASIIHMFVKKTTASTSFIMRTIQAEQLRLLGEYPKFDNQTLLAALQALVTYLILQALEAETWNQPGTICIGVRAIFEVSQKLLQVGEDGFTSKSDPPGQTPSWEEWAFFESHRRTVNLLYLLQRSLDHLTSLYSDMSIPCQGYDKVPLPCGQSLWSANALTEWEGEYQRRDPETEVSHVLKIGVISRALDFREKAAEFQTLQKWCSELDDFGTLIWTAARLKTS